MIDGYSLKAEARQLRSKSSPGTYLIPGISIFLPLIAVLVFFGMEGLYFYLPSTPEIDDFVLNMIYNHPIKYQGYSLVSYFLPILLSYWETNYYLHIVNNKGMHVSPIEVLKKFDFAVFLKFFCKIFVMTIIVFFWSLLFIFPGIYKLFSYFLVPYIAIDRPELGIFATLRESERLMRGQRMQTFMLSFSFVGWTLLSLFTFGLLNLYVQPYIGITFANMYNDLAYEHVHTQPFMPYNPYQNSNDFNNNPSQPDEDNVVATQNNDLNIYNSQTPDEINSLKDLIDHDNQDLNE